MNPFRNVPLQTLYVHRIVDANYVYPIRDRVLKFAGINQQPVFVADGGFHRIAVNVDDGGAVRRKAKLGQQAFWNDELVYLVLAVHQ